jgi:peroxiredoxin
MVGRRMLVAVVAGWVVTGWAAAAVPATSRAQQAAGPAAEKSMAGRPGGPESLEPPAPSRAQLVAELEANVAKLKAEHKGLTDELEAIATLASQEKATKTAERIRRLISTREKAFQADLASLERRLNGLRRTLTDEDKRARQANRVGAQAPLFALKGPDGKEVKLSDHKGKVVVLEWVDPESPSWVYLATKKTLAGLVAKYKDVVWLGINSAVGASPEADKKIVERYSLPYPVLDDSTGRTTREYGATTSPEVFVIDAKGVIVYLGAIDNSPMGRPQGQAANYLDQALTEVLAGKAVTTPQTKPNGTALGAKR